MPYAQSGRALFNDGIVAGRDQNRREAVAAPPQLRHQVQTIQFWHLVIYDKTSDVMAVFKQLCGPQIGAHLETVGLRGTCDPLSPVPAYPAPLYSVFSSP